MTRSAIMLTAASVTGVIAFGWPLLAAAPWISGPEAPLLLAGVLAMVLLVLATAFSDGAVDAKAVAVLGMLTAVGCILRPISAGTAGVELVFLVVILGGRVFGAEFGFILGATTLFTSALVTGGVGPWLPFQMIAAGWVGLGAGMLPRIAGRWEVVLLAGYGAVAAFGYGLAMNFSFWPFQLGGQTQLSFVAGAAVTENLRRFVMFSVATSLGWDVGRAVTTAVGLALLGRPVLGALRRTAARASFRMPAGNVGGS